MVGVMCLAMALAMIRRRTVPQAIGRMCPFGLRSGMIRADARAFRVVGSTWPVASSVSTLVRRWSAIGFLVAIP